ncbi:MAG: tyrosine-type recombinase/integrase [Pirellulaceae bacterium]
MSRPKAKTPALRYHLSGQSVVTIGGRDFYLGKHDSPESLARYAVLISTYQSHGLQLPDGFNDDQLKARAEMLLGHRIEPQHQENEPVTVAHVVASFREFAKVRYEGSRSELHRILLVCSQLEQYEGKTLAEKFGPLKLQEQRERWVNAEMSRRYVNRQTNLVVRIFKRAVSQELISQTTWQALKAVEPLRFGQTKAYETEPVRPVDIEIVRATAKFLPPVVRDMLRVQIATGMRPSEVCNLRPMDIDRSETVWMFRPVKHKTAGKGIRKAVAILGDAREVIENYLNRNPNSYCFSPIEAMAWRNTQKRAARKTKIQPSQISRAKANPTKSPRDHYDAQSFCKAIQSAAKAAGVASWHTYQIRHLAATVVCDALGREFAQSLLGHKESKMTERYTTTAERNAIEAAKHAPKL